MSDIIKLLPDSVANQIAAGEVIQRPASVIKELVENAVDAGATDIKIFIKDAGRTMIQVVDNGKGMSETDARMAFERHATSKIRGADDLFTLHTMGFRGEALPSICAISQVEMKTSTEGSPIGTHLVINASQVETQEPCACQQGTNIMVRNIFFNVPARRKFLKSDSVELSNIMREFERLALVNNNIRMSIDTGTRVLDLRAGTFKQRIGDIWKNSLDMHMLPVEVDTSLIKISGFISRPEYARRRNPLQYLIVNGRNMRHPYFHKAVMNCYDSLIAADTQPCYFLKFTVDPSTIDVNIHPTKNEIKFEYEQEIWPILQASVKAALGKYGAVPSIDFNSDVLPVDPLPPGELPEKPTLDLTADYNPFAESPSDFDLPVNPFPARQYTKSDPAPRDWESLYSDFMNGARGFHTVGGERQPSSVPQSDAPVAGAVDISPETAPEAANGIFGEGGEDENGASISSFCVQHAMRYIITTSREGLIIIDQHRAHVKILYERYLRKINQGEQVSQRMMFPESVVLDPEHREALGAVTEELGRLGFTLEYDEGDRWRITSVPALLKDIDARDVVLRILDSVCEGGENYGADGSTSGELLSRIALMMARSAAIQGGQRLSGDEMEHLVGELFALPDPAYTPNGNRIFCMLDSQRLEAMFR